MAFASSLNLSPGVSAGLQRQALPAPQAVSSSPQQPPRRCRRAVYGDASPGARSMVSLISQPSRHARVAAASPEVQASTSNSSADLVEIAPGVLQGYWQWKGYRIRYTQSGPSTGTPVVLVHGFGGNAGHWRKNIAELGKEGFNTFAIDLLGYGFSDKPDPRVAPPNTIYCFDNWGKQLCDFIEQVVGSPAILSCNSVGGLAGLQASIQRPDLVQGVQLLNISLRGLHVKRTPDWQRPIIAAFQRLLQTTEIGVAFFNSVAKPQTVRNILREAYGDKSAVTDELVEVILKPGLEPGAVRVFLDFISYSGGPLPEDLISSTTRPVSIIWGEADPWEDVKLGKKLFASLPPVVEWITLPGVGHCPQDEAPHKVNPLIAAFTRKYAGGGASAAGSSASAAAVSN